MTSLDTKYQNLVNLVIKIVKLKLFGYIQQIICKFLEAFYQRWFFLSALKRSFPLNNIFQLLLSKNKSVTHL